MAGARRMPRKTDKTDRKKEGGGWEVGGAYTSKSWESFLWFVCAPVMGYVQYRYDVKRKTNAFFLLPSQMGNDSLAFGYLERGSAGRSICMGPSVNTWFLLVISWCGPVVVNIAWQLTAWLFLSSLGGAQVVVAHSRSIKYCASRPAPGS